MSAAWTSVALAMFNERMPGTSLANTCVIKSSNQTQQETNLVLDANKIGEPRLLLGKSSENDLFIRMKKHTSQIGGVEGNRHTHLRE